MCHQHAPPEQKTLRENVDDSSLKQLEIPETHTQLTAANNILRNDTHHFNSLTQLVITLQPT